MFFASEFFTNMYGNMVLINKQLVNNILKINDPTYKKIINKIMCNPSSSSLNPCFMNQQIFNYYNIPHKKFFENDTFGNIKYQEQTNENKCFIKIVLPYFDIICVHLDAYYKIDRIEQLRQINSEITRATIIIGDFNFFNVNDFLVWINMICYYFFMQYILGKK